MSTCESAIPASSMRVVDVSGQSLAKVSQLSKYSSAAKHKVAAVIADGNNLMTLQGIQRYPALIQLSARDNSLVRMESVAALTNLVTLNLQNNSLTEIVGLESLINLQWLCLSGNSIRALSGLSANVRLSHLDLSDNCITELADVSMLNVLKTFLLHGNAISSLLRADCLIPASVETLSLAENEVEDLTQISSLASLKLLTQLSLMNNPCVSITDTQLFDSRPYVLHWCPCLTMLDGVEVTPQERDLSESLFPPNQPHPFSVGQHNLLVQYLTSTNPLSSTQMLVSTPSGMSSMYPENQENINPNNLSAISSVTVSSLTELEEMIKGTHSSESSSQSDLLQKLKALQLIDQMISTQEGLLSGHQGDHQQSQQPTRLALSRAGNGASPMQTPMHNHQETAEQVLPSHFLSVSTVATTDDADVIAPDLSVKGYETLAGIDSTEEMSDLSQRQGEVGETTHDQFNDGCRHVEVKTRSHDSQSSNPLSLKEKREEQLRLLNEKIAQRHSRLPRRTDLTHKTALSVSKKTSSSTRKQDSSKAKGTSAKVRPSGREKKATKQAKGTAKVAGKSPLSSKSAPTIHGSKSVTSSSVPPSHVPLSRDSPSHAAPISHLLPASSDEHIQSIAPPEVQHQLTSSQLKSLHISKQNTCDSSDNIIPLEILSSSQLVEIEETITADNSGMLDSTSCLIPVEGSSDETLIGDISTMTDDGVQMHSNSSLDIKKTDMACEHDSLASTLTQAYGFSATSDLFSTLASPHKERLELMEDYSANSMMRDLSTVQPSLLPPSTSSVSTMTTHKAATVIQAAWRGFQARKREREIAQVYRELNTTKLETCVATVYSQLQLYREELSHQASVVQRQEETIQSLTKEVELLLKWKTKSETAAKVKAATIIQKHWRGYTARKRYPRICHGLVPRSLGATWAVLHSLTRQVEEMSVALSSVQDVCGTREKFHSQDFLEAHLPSATDLQLTHFSSTCVLLHWTPAVPAEFSGVILQGYRVYVNGIPEGMVGPAKSKAYIEGLDPKTTYRITVRVVYNTGESCDSNTIIASLDAHSGKAVHTKKSDSGGNGEGNVTDTIQQTERDSNIPSRKPLQTSPATRPGSCGIVQTETHSQVEFLPPEQNNSGPQEEHSLSHSTTPNQVVNSGTVDEQSPSSPNAGRKSHSSSPPPTTSHTEIGVDGQCGGTRDGGDDNETKAQIPPDFDGTHLFRLVPKAHHITDETVSVMSNATEEYIGGSSSRDTISHDRSLTSMIFGARTSGDSLSESSLSDSESGDKEAKKLDQNIEQIQNSYLSQLSPQSSDAGTSQEKEDKREAQKTDNSGQLHYLQADYINRDLPPTPSNVTHVNASSHPPNATAAPPSFGIPTPHPLPFPFDDVSSAGSKRMPQPLHLLSNVQLQGDVQRLAFTTTTLLTSDPDSLTTSLGSTLQTDTDGDDTFVRNKAPRPPKEMLPEKFMEVAIADGSGVSHSQSCGTIKEGNELSPLSCPSVGTSQACQVVSGEQTTTHPIITSSPLGSQTAPGAFHVANVAQQSCPLLLGSAVQIVPNEMAGSSTPNNYGIPEGVTGDLKRDKNLEEKPVNENLESDASSTREDSKDERNGGMNKSNLEMAIGRAGTKVELPSQLVEDFDPLQDCEKLPSVATNANLIGSIAETKTSHCSQSTGTGGVPCASTGTGGVPCVSTSQPLANKPQIIVSREQQSPSAAEGDQESKSEAMTTASTYKTMQVSSSGSSALLASLLLSQLESDLNTA